MVLASAQLRARPERKDGGHPTLCNAPPTWLRMNTNYTKDPGGTRPERNVGSPSSFVKVAPQWLRMRHKSHQSHQTKLFLLNDFNADT